MKPTSTDHEAVNDDEPLVHNWRVSQLTRPGIPGALAETYADRIDWHQIARLVRHGCHPAARAPYRLLPTARGLAR